MGQKSGDYHLRKALREAGLTIEAVETRNRRRTITVANREIREPTIAPGSVLPAAQPDRLRISRARATQAAGMKRKNDS
jgi:hypothetical protein